MFNYATKLDLKDAAGFDTSNLAAKSDLAILKVDLFYKLSITKIKQI